jgi:hypothetical protein
MHKDDQSMKQKTLQTAKKLIKRRAGDIGRNLFGQRVPRNGSFFHR